LWLSGVRIKKKTFILFKHLRCLNWTWKCNGSDIVFCNLLKGKNVEKGEKNIFSHFFIFVYLKQTQMIPICKISFRFLKKWRQESKMYSNGKSVPSPLPQMMLVQKTLRGSWFQKFRRDGRKKYLIWFRALDTYLNI